MEARQRGKSADRKLAAERFVQEWKNRGQEDEHDETFWNQFLQEVMGIDRVHHVIDYQKKVKIGNSWKRIDAYIPSSKVLIEQKSKGIDLTKKAKQSDGDELSPFEQAMRYAGYLPISEQPNFVITSNFQAFYIYDRDKDPAGEEPVIIELDELPQQLQAFNFIVDPVNQGIARQKQLNLEAARLIGEVYERISKQYHDPDAARHDLAVLMVRILFCLYAEDSGLFEEGLFYRYLKEIPAGEGVFRDALIKLFKVLNTPTDERDAYLGETLAQFPYVNGGLFADDIEIPIFTNDIKYQMLQKAGYEFDWSEISPVIFGSIFESILSGEERRAGGMHYTSVENIHKVIDPLFLNDLRLEYQKAGNNKSKLRELQDKIASLSFLDPACGSGNFLTQTYLELRSLENEILARLIGDQMAMEFAEAGFPSFVKVNVGQFYGIEINDFAVSVASTALWIADHQSNQKTARLINRPVVNLPLKDYKHIVCANALRINWNDVLPAEKCSYIMGNPPFIGSSNCSAEQKQEIVDLFGKIKRANSIDYVASWFYKASEFMLGNQEILAAFVATNSITQGEQVKPIWSTLYERFNIGIVFAWKTFIWNSQAANKAHVHCVIIGFSRKDKEVRWLFDDGTKKSASQINPYLADAPVVIVDSRYAPFSEAPKMVFGSKPVDNGQYIFSKEELDEFLAQEPLATFYIHPFLGSYELINSIERYCLYLNDAPPHEIRKMRFVQERIDAVKRFRQSSTSTATQKAADTPARFFTEAIPSRRYIALPEVSSERRFYIPVAFLEPDVLPSNKLLIVANGELYHFGILNSQFHNAWMRVVAGRLKSDYQYSASMVYNTFSWPDATYEHKMHIEELAQVILAIRLNYPESSLADLYDPLTMPPDLLKAHKALDKAVEQAYGVNFNGDEEKIVAHLFKLYAEATAGERGRG